MQDKTYDIDKIITGEDLVHAGIFPQTPEERLGIVTDLRLEALLAHAKSRLDPHSLGEWKPLFAQRHTTLDRVEGYHDIKTLLEAGRIPPNTLVEGIANYSGIRYVDGKGVLVSGEARTDNQSRLMVPIQWTTQEHSALSQGAPVYVGLAALRFIASDNAHFITGTKYELIGGVVFDKNLGHKVRFNEEYAGTVPDINNRLGGAMQIKVAKNTVGMLVEERPPHIRIKFDKPIGNDIREALFTKDYVAPYLEVSSLGQQEPLMREEVIREDVLTKFLPKTALSADRAELIAIAMLAGKDLGLIGDPGSGKSSAAEDIVTICSSSSTIFRVRSHDPNYVCKFQCNPYSLFDVKFAKTLDACPECKAQYDPSFLRTGRFKRPSAAETLVEAIKFDDGTGIERIDGTLKPRSMGIIGYKLPAFDTDGNPAKSSNFDPTGFQAGKLPRANNGIVVIEELDKMGDVSQNLLLEACSKSMVAPEELRHPLPSRSLAVMTANTSGNIVEALIDRVFFVHIPYPSTVDQGWDVTRRSKYKQFASAEDVAIADPLTKKPLRLEHIPIPSIIGKAVNAFYLKFRNEYKGQEFLDKGRATIGGNRSLLDALAIAQVKLYVDHKFYNDAPHIVDEKHAMFGINFAMRSRVQNANDKERAAARSSLSDFMMAEFPALVRAEKDTWWCNAYKSIGIAATQITEIGTNLRAEMPLYMDYASNPAPIMAAYAAVNEAWAHPNNDVLQLARIKYPLMNYLRTPEIQPYFEHLNPKELIALMGFFMEASKVSTCKLD